MSVNFLNKANRKFTCKSSIGPLRATDGSLTSDPVLKTELLQSVFSSASTIDNGTLPPSSNNANTTATNSNKLSTILFTATLVKRVIRRFTGKAKGGPDDIPPIFLKQCCSQLASLQYGVRFFSFYI